MTPTARHYVLDGSDRDLRRLLRIAEVQADSARAAISRIGNLNGWRTIECGCGPLGSLGVLSELVGTSGVVVGLDFHAPTVERARAVLSALDIHNVEVVVGDVHDVHGDDIGAPFDLAYTRAFLMHQPDPGRTLKSIAELLRPGGWLITQEPLRTPPPRSAPALDALPRYWRLMHEAAVQSGVVPDAVERLPRSARRAGFDVVAMNGFFNVVEPSIGFEIHASAIAALRGRLVQSRVASDEDVDALERSLVDAVADEHDWVTTPFMVELTLRKTA